MGTRGTGVMNKAPTDFRTYVKAVGTGPKSNYDLDFEASMDMMRQILEQKPYAEQIAAFLTGWRLKPETNTEFRGALAACDAASSSDVILPDSLELGYPFDGKAKNPYLLPLIAEALDGTDLDLVVTGDEPVPASEGVTLKQLAASVAFGTHLHYFDRKTYCPPMHALSGIRQRIGLRTGLNTIEKLPRVAQSDYAITGVFHRPYVHKYVEIFGERYKRFALIQGNEGTPELFGKGRLWIAEAGEITEYIIDPEAYGIRYEKSIERISLEASLQMTKDPVSELRALARLNAAVYLFVAGRYESIEAAYEEV